MLRAGIGVVMFFSCAAIEAATITALPGGGMWHYGTTWDSGTVPTANDDVRLDATSGNVIMRNTQQCRSLDCTGYTGTLTLNVGRYLMAGYTDTPSGNYVTLSPTMTLNALVGSVLFCGRPGGPVRGVVSAGQPIPQLTLYNGELLDDVLVGGNGLYCYEYFTSNNHTIIATAVRVSGYATAAYFGTSAIDCGYFEAQTYAVCSVADASLTIVGGFTQTLQANGVTFGVVALERGLGHSLRGNNTFEAIALTGAIAATSIKFQTGKTTTLTGPTPLPSGDAGGQLTLYGTGAWTLSKASDFVLVDYVTLQNSQATGGATFAAGPNSVDAGGNSGWGF